MTTIEIVTQDEAITEKSAKRAIEKLAAFVPGVLLYATHPDRATLRLSFATADLAKIEEGVGRLGAVV